MTLKSLFFLFILGLVSVAEADEIAVSSLDLGKMQQGYGTPQVDKSVDQHPLSVGKVAYGQGIGTHADETLFIDLHGSAQSFSALVGVDDEVDGGSASMRFSVTGDGKTLWQSQEMKPGQPAAEVKVDLGGIKILGLLVKATGGSIMDDHGDWINAKIICTGTPPVAVEAPSDDKDILTPPAPETPRINGPGRFGVRPNSPFFYAIPATGKRPMTFSVDKLPSGLTLDAATGRITGSLATPGTYPVVFRAKNDLGSAERIFQIVVGEEISLTPPMGWNSWNCWAENVDQEKVLRSAKALVDSGLDQHGWSYVNIDDTWQGARTGPDHALLANEKFPDMKGLSDAIHGMGLRMGIYSTPWITSYAGFTGGAADNPGGYWSRDVLSHSGRRMGSYSFSVPDARQWAAWGVDYLKYDWSPNRVPETKDMADALRSSGRDIIFSLSNSAPFEGAAGYAPLANCWRITGDISDNWKSLVGNGFNQARWEPYAKPGHWNDPDMLIVGQVGWGRTPHPTHLTPDEQYTHISLWCLLSAPLLLGCDMEKLDPFTLSLLTNDEVLAVDQDALGRQATRVAGDNGLLTDIYAKPMEDGTWAVGLFNRGEAAATVKASWSDLHLSGPQPVRDLWRQKDLGTFTDEFSTTVPSHGVVLVRVGAPVSR